MNASRRHAPHRSSGIGLIEILIALVLVSVGFLAAAKMQLEGMRFSQSAYFQSQAYFLASEMIDRMRANVEAVADGDYDDRTISSSASDPGCNTRTCMPADIADQDLYDWSVSILAVDQGAGVIGALPSEPDNEPTATITPLGDDAYRIELTWPEIVKGQSTTETLSVDFTSQAL